MENLIFKNDECSNQVEDHKLEPDANLFVIPGIKAEEEEISSVASKFEIGLEVNNFQEKECISIEPVKSEEFAEWKFQVNNEIRSRHQNSFKEMDGKADESRSVGYGINSSMGQIKIENQGYDEDTGIEPDDDWTERFIQTIKGKPALYNKELKEHSDRNYVYRLWTEVGETTIPAWPDFTANEKIIKGREIQRRWQNLRTCFRRELNKQIKTKTKTGQSASKRRKYIYFDQLLFLLPTMETISESSPPQRVGDNSDNEEVPTEETVVQSKNILRLKMKKKNFFSQSSSNIVNDKNTEKNSRVILSTTEEMRTMSEFSSSPRKRDDFENYDVHDPIYEAPVRSRNNPEKKQKKTTTSYEETLLNILREKKTDEDEDRLFLLSLVPSFKKMTDDQKFEAKMEFLSVIRRITCRQLQSIPGHSLFSL